MVQIKNNLAAFGHSKAFRLTETGFEWIGDYEITAGGCCLLYTSGAKKRKVKRGFRTKKEALNFEAEYKRTAKADLSLIHIWHISEFTLVQ